MLIYRSRWRWSTARRTKYVGYALFRMLPSRLLLLVRKSRIMEFLQLAMLLSFTIFVCLPVVGLLWVATRSYGWAVRRLTARFDKFREKIPGSILYDWRCTYSKAREVFVMELEDNPTDRNSLRNHLMSVVSKDPRFKMILKSRFGCHLWKTYEGFKIDDHVHDKTDRMDVSEVALLEDMSSVMSKPFPEDRPPWFVEILQFKRPTQINRTAYVAVFQVHPLLSRPLLNCLQSSSAKISFPKARSSKAGSVDLSKILYNFETITRSVIKVVTFLKSIPDYLHKEIYPCLFSQKTLLTSPLNDCDDNSLSLSWSQEIPLEFFRQLQIKLECKLDTVVLSCIAGALRRYLVHTVGECPSRILSGLVKPSGNVASLGMVLGNADPLSRLRFFLDRENQNVASELRTQYVANFMTWLSSKVLPTLVNGRVRSFLNKKYDLMINQVQMDGFGQAVLDNNNNRVKMMHAWSVLSAETGLSLSVVRFNGSLVLDVTARRRLFQRTEVLVAGFSQEVQDLALALGVRTGRRNISSPPSPLPASVRLNMEMKRSPSAPILPLVRPLSSAEELLKNARVAVIHRKLANLVFVSS